MVEVKVNPYQSLQEIREVAFASRSLEQLARLALEAAQVLSSSPKQTNKLLSHFSDTVEAIAERQEEINYIVENNQPKGAYHGNQ